MRQLPTEVSNYQDNCRQETINKVQNAINELKSEGFIVTRKLLLERTNLSNSVLSKPHVKKVLKENKVCQYAVRKKVNGIKEADVMLDLNKATKKIEKLEEKIKELENKLNRQKLEYNEMKEDNKILRGELHILKQKARLRGFELD